MNEIDRLSSLAASTLHLFRLDGKAAVVIGGNRGIGQAMALALAAAGADVGIVARGPSGLKETAEAIDRLGRRGRYFSGDMTDEEQVRRMVDSLLKCYGHLDILVNSQGAVHLQAATEFDTGLWQRVVDVNLKSVFLCCKHVGKVMLTQRKGKIINISSVRSVQGRAEDLAYAPTKGAVNQLTRSLAIEWGPLGINVNAIAPTFTRTAMAAPILNDPVKREWVLSRIPMKRIGELEDFFGPVVFLASEASNLVNGHILFVDGGWTAA